MHSAHLNRSKGMSLVEVLVGMMIGLIGIVVIMQVYLVNENFKRTTTAGGGAQINGSIALYSLQRDILSAGYGISDSRVLDCGHIKYYYNGTYSSPPGAAAGALAAIRVAPVKITDGSGAGIPDTITVMYGDSATRVVPATLSLAMANAGANVRVDNVAGFNDPATTYGDLVLVVATGDCTLMNITTKNTSTLDLAHASTSLWNPVTGGSFTAYPIGATVFALGRPTVNVYTINSDKLQQLQLFTWAASNVVPVYNSTATTITDGIVDMKAQYGKDTNGDGIVDTFDKVLPTTAAGWKQVLSIRVGILARSQNYEKPASGTTCTETATQPTWAGSVAVTGTNPTASPFNIALPSCYKYKVLETIIPLRNMLWSRT